MVRMQIQLEESEHRRLRRLARRIDVSMSELIRRCVAERLASDEAEPTRAEAVQAALAVCGKYEDPGGATRVAEEHDRHLADAIAR